MKLFKNYISYIGNILYNIFLLYSLKMYYIIMPKNYSQDHCYTRKQLGGSGDDDGGGRNDVV